MLSIVLLGTGNVSRHLFDAFKVSNKLSVIQVIGRNPAALNYFKNEVVVASNFDNLADADIYIIALNDDSIAAVSQQLKLKDKLLVHTSGSVAISALSSKNRSGVLYLLQSISKDRDINFKEVPICIEAEKEHDLDMLKKVAAELSDKVHIVSSTERRSLHLAAVFVNNFVNHLFTIGSEICKEHQLSFSMLHPLILETFKKIEEIPPLEAQTGPARRNDKGTLEKHKNLLTNNRHKEIYSLLSQSIIDTYEKKL